VLSVGQPSAGGPTCCVVTTRQPLMWSLSLLGATVAEPEMCYACMLALALPEEQYQCS
jgi:hypothetical protein